MNYTGLSAIIKSIKSSVTCPNCESGYSNDDLAVVSAIDERCIVVAQCPDCSSAILITAALQTKHDMSETDQMGIGMDSSLEVDYIDEEALVSSDDVVSVHEVLRDFKGDLKKLVGKIKK